MSTSTIRSSGYRPCACRDCFEIAIGEAGAMCHACEDAGCSGDGECSAPGAYGGDEPEPTEPEALQQVTLVMAQNAVTNGARIRTECEANGRCIISHGTFDPCLVIPRLLSALQALDTHAALRVVRLITIPVEALSAEQHPFWAGADAERLVCELMTALNRAAPPGFEFFVEGAWHNMGFFRQ